MIKHPGPLLFFCLAAIIAAASPAEVATAEQASTARGATKAAEPGAQATKRKGVSLKLKTTRYGRILFSGSGRAIYLFAKETTKRSRCYGTCARAWPPVLTRGKPRARKGVERSKLGTIKRRGGGRKQVTYNGHPLYYYAHDPRNQVLCQNVFQFGGKWYVVNSAGSAIT